MTYHPILVRLEDMLISINKEIENYNDSYDEYKKQHEFEYQYLLMVRESVINHINDYREVIENCYIKKI